MGQPCYVVKMDNGFIFKRHIDQLTESQIQKKRVTFRDEVKPHIADGHHHSSLSVIVKIPESLPVQLSAPSSAENLFPSETLLPRGFNTNEHLHRSSGPHQYLNDYVIQ
ncbi:unnamed protein product [Nezara viridula]|uniref:Uncharacterized protein n=1 Tax=Nezara viridula TaxID=85310 RepID=A0A9P0GWD1_NEZVI|nr:unnamed protein product [Nezara viridula]